MTLVIAGQARRAYVEAVIAAIFRLLAIAAMILMPLGMGVTPAAAAALTAHTTMGGSEEGHCGQKSESETGKAMAMQCAGSCGALPAELAAAPVKELAPIACLAPDRVKVLHGVMLPLSTPPPRVG